MTNRAMAGKGRTPAIGPALLGALAALLALAFALCSAPATAGAQPLRTGVSYVWENDNAAVFANVKRTGARTVLAPMRWHWVAPEEEPASWNPEDPADPNYNWSEFDAWVSHAVAAGLTPVLQIRGGPEWAQRCQIRIESAPCDPDPAKLAAFATAAARRYSGEFSNLPRVRYWQGLNEMNLSLFFNPQFIGDKAVSAELFRTLINSFYAAVKAVNPSNIVVAGGLGPIAVPGHTIGPMRFTRELLCMKGRENFRPAKGDCHGGVNFDIFDVHPYTTGGPTHEGGPNDVQIGQIDNLARLIAAADKAGRINSTFKRTPLWITEFSWDSNPPDPTGLAMPILSRWTAEVLHSAWQVGVHTFFWFSIRDFPPDLDFPASPALDSGLYFRGPTVAEDQPKEVLFAFRFPFVAYPKQGGLSFWGRTPNSKGGKVSIQVLTGGKWRNVAVVRANKTGIFRGVADSAYGRGKNGQARAVYSGEGSVPFSMRPVADFRQPPFGTNYN
jgi:Cellulase (glycosyl hydrolase family 5)